MANEIQGPEESRTDVLAGAPAPPPTRSLRAAAHPQARMQELLSREAPLATAPLADPARNTENHTEENTEKNTPSHTESDTELLAEVHPSIQKRRRKRVQMEGNAPSFPSTRPSGSAPARTSISQRISDELQREPVVRKTIDIPAGLNERLQEYCAARRIKTERRVFLVLLETFLEEEGF